MMENKVSEKKQKLKKIIDKGDMVLSEEMQAEWFFMCCKINYSELNYYILEEALAIMEKLNELQIDDVITYFYSKNYDNNIATSILNIVVKYHSKGQVFLENILGKSETNNEEIKTSYTK